MRSAQDRVWESRSSPTSRRRLVPERRAVCSGDGPVHASGACIHLRSERGNCKDRGAGAGRRPSERPGTSRIRPPELESAETGRPSGIPQSRRVAHPVSTRGQIAGIACIHTRTRCSGSRNQIDGERVRSGPSLVRVQQQQRIGRLRSIPTSSGTRRGPSPNPAIAAFDVQARAVLASNPDDGPDPGPVQRGESGGPVVPPRR